ncbi:MAG: hypothetical protein R3A44_13820 [Caldilineaceae bacterium]
MDPSGSCAAPIVTWQEVIGADFGRNYNYAIADLVEFNNQLYAGTWHWNWDEEKSEGGEIWRSSDGISWAPVVTGGFGAAANQGIARLAVFQDQLYAFTATAEENGQMQLWRTGSGNSGDWQQVTGGPFAIPSNIQAATVEIYQERLYLGVYNSKSGGQMWRTSNGGQWEQVNASGWGGAQTSAIASLEPFNGQLYAGTRNTINGGEIWHSTDGVTWSRVSGGGIDNANNTRMYNLTAWNRQLYVMAGNTVTGAEIWNTNDGATWNQISDAGWGDSNNEYSNLDGAASVFNGALYFGAGNWANGVEIWRYADGSISHSIDPSKAQQLTYSAPSSGDVRLDVPAGAVEQPLVLVYEPLAEVTAPTGLAFGHTAFDLDAYINDQLQQGFTFSKPVNVTITYSDADIAGLNESTLLLMWWNADANAWQDAACGAYVRQPAQNQLSVPICHLSRFGLFGGGMGQLFLPLIQR